MNTTTTKLPASAPANPDALAFYRKVQDLVESLYSRWLDEKEYEDINDYAAPIRTVANEFGITIRAMSRSPFGFTFSTKDARIYRLTINGKKYAYARIG